MIATFTTPNGAKVTAEYREDTSDWNTLSACIHDDEYGLADHAWAGIALDVGAHIGGATLALLADNPELKVVAIEALPENARLMQSNLERNGFADRTKVLNAAAVNQSIEELGDVLVAYGASETPFEAEHRFIGGAVWQGSGKHVSVPGIALRHVVGGNGPLALLKIDCEGCEWSFLDDPAVAQVAEIRGEFHTRGDNGATRLRELLEPTHTVTVDDSSSFGPFRAVRR